MIKLILNGPFPDFSIFAIGASFWARGRPVQHSRSAFSFSGVDTGWYPASALVHDAADNLYGTTYGGSYVFKLDPAGKETILYTLGEFIEGGYPGTLIQDADGNLYGTAGAYGLLGAGSVFKLDPSGTMTVLHSFAPGDANGSHPNSPLVRDVAGNFYGTTAQGGDLACAPGSGCGTIFKIDTVGALTVLYFTGGLDGAYPQAGLICDAAGNLYGTNTGGLYNLGTAFKLDTAGTLTVLHSFLGGTDGSYPLGGLLRDPGNIYGVTQHGGDPTCKCGVVFKIEP